MPQIRSGSTRNPRRRVAVAVAMMSAIASGCGLPVFDTPASSAPATTVPPTQPVDPSATSVESTSAPTEATAASSTSGSVATQSVPASSAPTGSSVDQGADADASTPVSTDEIPVYEQELVLSDTGLGARPFGSEPEDVITYVQSLLGSPTEDSGWIEAAEYPACPGKQVRIVEWGVLSLQFSDASPVKSDGQHFFGWTYGAANEIGESPAGLQTIESFGLGGSLAEAKAAYPDIELSEGDADTAFPDSFYVPDRYWGLLSGPTDDDVVTQISSALGCGE